MNDWDEKKLAQLLKDALPPVDTEPRRDLWPAMLRRMEQRAAAAAWLDWALAALVLLWLFVFPEAIPRLLYHL